MPASGQSRRYGQRWRRTASSPLLLVRSPGSRSRRARINAAALNSTCLLLDNTRRVALSTATGVLALCSVALGTYAGFSAETVGPGNTFATGTVQMADSFGDPDSASRPASFSFGTVSDLLPGESITRYLDLTNNGTLAFDLSLLPTVTVSSALDSHTTTGKRLQLQVTRCPAPGAWSSSGGSVSCTYAQGRELLYSGQINPGTTIPLTAGKDAVGAGTVAQLELTVTLPSAATDFAGLRSTLQFQWTATNR